LHQIVSNPLTTVNDIERKRTCVANDDIPGFVFKSWPASNKNTPWLKEANGGLIKALHSIPIGHPQPAASTWLEHNNKIKRDINQYEEMLKTYDEKLPQFLNECVSCGTFGVEPIAPYEDGIVGRRARVHLLSRDQKRQHNSEYNVIAEEVTVVQDCPDNFWACTFPCQRDRVTCNLPAQSLVDVPVAEVSSMHRVHARRHKKQHQQQINTHNAQDESHQPEREDKDECNPSTEEIKQMNEKGFYLIDKILRHQKYRNTYRFRVKWKDFDDDSDELWSKLKETDALKTYINNCGDHELQQFHHLRVGRDD
jgi:hypothetical protein